MSSRLALSAFLALAPLLAGCKSDLDQAGAHPRSPEAALAGTPEQRDASLLAVEREIVRLTNVERQQRGLRPLEADPALARVAYQHALRMAEEGKLAHELDGRGPDERVTRAGIRWQMVSENLHSKAASRNGRPLFEDEKYAADAVRSWMNSPGHRKNLLDPTPTRVGIGVVRVERGERGIYYATQLFMKPPS